MHISYPCIGALASVFRDLNNVLWSRIKNNVNGSSNLEGDLKLTMSLCKARKLADWKENARKIKELRYYKDAYVRKRIEKILSDDPFKCIGWPRKCYINSVTPTQRKYSTININEIALSSSKEELTNSENLRNLNKGEGYLLPGLQLVHKCCLEALYDYSNKPPSARKSKLYDQHIAKLKAMSELQYSFQEAHH